MRGVSFGCPSQRFWHSYHCFRNTSEKLIDGELGLLVCDVQIAQQVLANDAIYRKPSMRRWADGVHLLRGPLASQLYRLPTPYPTNPRAISFGTKDALLAATVRQAIQGNLAPSNCTKKRGLRSVSTEIATSIVNKLLLGMDDELISRFVDLACQREKLENAWCTPSDASQELSQRRKIVSLWSENRAAATLLYHEFIETFPGRSEGDSEEQVFKAFEAIVSASILPLSCMIAWLILLKATRPTKDVSVASESTVGEYDEEPISDGRSRSLSMFVRQYLTPAWLLERRLLSTFRIAGQLLTKGTPLFVSPLYLHWRAIGVEKFSDLFNNPNIKAMHPPENLMTYGYGRRSCPLAGLSGTLLCQIERALSTYALRVEKILEPTIMTTFGPNLDQEFLV